MKLCNFCGTDIEQGTGKMYIKISGTVLNFCSSKCEKNMINLGRKPRKTKWTKEFLDAKKVQKK